MLATTLHNLTAAKQGVVGPRQLILVQTLDIARLTAHPVRLIPETFIAVTGMGPIDSNESGKTSFLAAVALLLGDPEWRVSGSGAGAAASLLFEPVTAGITGASAATEGYVVGVFADPANISESTCTVWMKISSGTPYIQVKYALGICLATGSDDRERHLNASRVFRSLPGETWGGGEFAEKLYGRSPRVLAYVASRGQVRSRPSLLKLDAGTFNPEQIGDALISLTGRAALFERDEQDRRDLANKQAELKGHIENDRKHIEREDAILRQVDAREDLRSKSVTALRLRNASLARAVLDSYTRAESAKSLLGKTTAARKELADNVEELTTRREGLRNIKQLEDAVKELERKQRVAADAHEQGVRVGGEIAGELNSLGEQREQARRKAEGYDLKFEPLAEEAARTRDELAEAVGEARSDLKTAKAGFDSAVQARQEATEGQFGESGKVIRLLDEKGVTALSLIASIRLDNTHRQEWEARLAPWRDALVVAHHDLTAALPLLQNHPGTILISHPDTGNGQQDSGSALPTGLESAPAEALTFLEALSRQDFMEEPVTHVHADHIGLRVIGGFSAPIVGFDDLVAHWDQQVALAEQNHTDRQNDFDRATKLAQLAVTNATRAQAAEHFASLIEKIGKLQGRLAVHRQDVMPPLSKALDDVESGFQAAKDALAERTQLLDLANRELSDAQNELGTLDEEIQKCKAAGRPDDAVLAAWNRGFDAALRELGWQALTIDDDYDQFVDEATPPAGGDGGSVERRSSAILQRLAHDKLVDALASFRVYPDSGAPPPPEIAEAASTYVASRETDSASADQFLTTLAHISAWLDDSAEQDASAPEAVKRARADRQETTDFVSAKCLELEQALVMTQGAIKQRAASALDRISKALDALNRNSRGLGAELDYTLLPPGSPDKKWVCQVIPRWRRNPEGPMLAYDNVTNTAQEKLFSIHLVLAALLAAPSPEGRVLILDELADSLGAEHRREVLDAIAEVAGEHRITILATCQDSIMSEASPHCGEILYFHYPSKSEALNRPTRMFGVDQQANRVELTAGALLEGRELI